MQNQLTIKNPIRFSGLGLHSGNRVELSLLPAPSNSGIRFRRVDLDGQPEIAALIENVGETNRSTSLVRGNMRIHTVEHVLSALAGFGIDNAVIEINANEPPIGDGSARELSRLIEATGVLPLPDPKEPITIEQPIELQMGESVMTAFPHDRFKISCVSAGRQGQFTQHFSVELSPETWLKELCHARTFCYYDEIEALIKNGLIKGGSLENAVVLRDDAVLTTEPLRYSNEFVRHKILDVIGDLALLGRPLHAHIIAIKPSHAVNCQLGRLILNQVKQTQVAVNAFTPPPVVEKTPEPEPAANQEPSSGPESFDIFQVMKLVPHRYPFLMVDKVVKVEGNKAVAIKNVSINEPYFQGHFPTHPIMPGVLQLEAIAQVAGFLMIRQAKLFRKFAYFMSADNVKWRKPVRPGDTLVIEIELNKVRGKIGKATGVCKVDGDIVSEAEVTFLIGDA